jgi:hypothetical protein
MAFQFSSTAFRFSSTAFHFPRNPRKSIYGEKYTKDCYSSFVFFATRSPSFVIPAKQYLCLTQQQLLPAIILFIASLFKHMIQWLLFVTHLFFITRLGQTILSFLLMALCLAFIVPKVFHSFYKSVYDFRPKHCKQSFWEILTQPVPGIKFKGRLGKSADTDSLQ